MKLIWVIGVGQFGYHAVKSLSKRHKNWHFVLVDPVEENLLKARGVNRTIEKADGVAFLNEHLRTGNLPSWIIPALPVHLAAQWCHVRMGLDKLSRVEIPLEIDLILPNPMRGIDGDLYVSNADFICPGNCNEPDDFCTVTKKPRKQDMYVTLGNVELKPFKSIVVQSRQLGPGVGGYKPAQLFSLLEKIDRINGKFLLSTACRCHGVMTGFSRI